METSPLLPPDPSIYDSLEALETYLNDVRARREQRRQARLEIERLCVAIQKVETEWEAAQQDDDPEIMRELEAVLREFQRRLEQARDRVPTKATASVAALESSPVEEPLTAALPGSEEPTEESFEAPMDARAPRYEALSEPASVAVSSLSNEEREAQQRAWLEELEALGKEWDLIENAGLCPNGKALDRPACFQMRALACTLARIQTEAAAAGLSASLEPTVNALRDRMEMARHYAEETSEALPFSLPAWTDSNARLSAEDWNELARLYRGIAEAQRVWDWYLTRKEFLGEKTQQDLLNAAGAAQQMLFRRLEKVQGKDRLQADLYSSLRETTKTVGPLGSFCAETKWETLEKRAGTLSQLFIEAQKEAEDRQEKDRKEARKKAAIQAVLQWQPEYEGEDPSEAAIAKARETLLPLLDECLAAGVPPTNVQVRGALLQTAPALLRDLPRYAKFLEAVLTERKRKGLDLPSILDEEEPECEEDLPDAQVTQTTELLRLMLEGQKVLILGGSARSQVAQKLKERLECADVEWMNSKKSDRMNRFKTSISHADVVVVVMKFASHEMTEKTREWTKEQGKQFVLLPSGYGVNQIIHQMGQQLIPPDVHKKSELPEARAAVSGLASFSLCPR